MGSNHVGPVMYLLNNINRIVSRAEKVLFRFAAHEYLRLILVAPELLQPLLVDVELHAEDEVGVLDHGVGDEEGHRGERGQPVHLPDGDEHERDAGDDEQRVRRHFVRAALKR